MLQDFADLGADRDWRLARGAIEPLDVAALLPHAHQRVEPIELVEHRLERRERGALVRGPGGEMDLRAHAHARPLDDGGRLRWQGFAPVAATENGGQEEAAARLMMCTSLEAPVNHAALRLQMPPVRITCSRRWCAPAARRRARHAAARISSSFLRASAMRFGLDPQRQSGQGAKAGRGRAREQAARRPRLHAQAPEGRSLDLARAGSRRATRP